MAKLLWLPLGPPAWLGLLFCMRTGRDLTIVLFAGFAAFVCLGIILLLVGITQRRANRAWAGGAVLASVLMTAGACVVEIYWLGFEERELVLVVQDATTKQPIDNAIVQIFRKEGAGKAETGQTDSDGKVRLSHTFKAFGCTSAVRRTAAFCPYSDDTVEVDATGYRRFCEPLGSMFAGANVHGPPLPPITVSLKKMSRGAK